MTARLRARWLVLAGGVIAVLVLPATARGECVHHLYGGNLAIAFGNSPRKDDLSRLREQVANHVGRRESTTEAPSPLPPRPSPCGPGFNCGHKPQPIPPAPPTFERLDLLVGQVLEDIPSPYAHFRDCPGSVYSFQLITRIDHPPRRQSI
jgi:hypothetical protein